MSEAETAADPVAALSEEALPSWEEPEAKPRKKRAANEERLKGLPVEQVFLDVPEEERICGVYGTLMETIGTEFVRRERKFIPAKVKFIEYYSVNYGVRRHILISTNNLIIRSSKWKTAAQSHLSCRFLPLFLLFLVSGQ